jgi:signal transduction histidine kinase
MMHKLLITGIKILIPLLLVAQQKEPAATLLDLETASNDSLRYIGNMKLGFHYQELNRDSSFFYYSRALEVSKKNNKKFAQVSALALSGYQLIAKGDYADALLNLLDAFNIIEETPAEKNSWLYFSGSSAIKDNRTYVLSLTQHVYSVLMNNAGNTNQEIFYLKEAIKNGKIIDDPYRIGLPYMNLGHVYFKLNMLDSALYCEKESLKYLNKAVSVKYLTSVLTWMGHIYMKKGNKELAKKYYYASIQSAIDQDNIGAITGGYYGLSKYYKVESAADSGIYYAIRSLESIRRAANSRHMDFSIGDLYENLADCYELDRQADSTRKYQRLALKAKDSIYLERINNLTKFQNLNFNQQLRLRDLEKDKLAYQGKIRTYFLLGGLAVFSLIALILFRNNRQKQKTNKILQEQKDKVENTLQDLKATQSQLIQSEKMASLGELTAGIAHEIQNPLNFVNNFSEVNKELIEELKGIRHKADSERDPQLEDELLDDIAQNEDKINHHGKRADAIVKGMLQHSSSGSGKKEPTDINALADEYLRLAYHGLRAKDKSFNATMKTDFDEGIGMINIIPQDMGRVILNLITNAFYVVDEKKKSGIENYEPTVKVATKLLSRPSGGPQGGLPGGTVIISVADNGKGIPQKILDKIFQPFFTTKPTGQGTGLGLSLSYDIVKAQGGEIRVETKEGEGTEFIISLPINQ